MSGAVKQVSEQNRDFGIGMADLETYQSILVCAYAGNQNADANKGEVETDALQFYFWQEV